MQISFSLTPLSIIPSYNFSPVAPAAATPDDSAQFTQIAELNDKLQALPEVRSKEVQKGKALVEGPVYPPLYTILGLARLLAMRLGDNSGLVPGE